MFKKKMMMMIQTRGGRSHQAEASDWLLPAERRPRVQLKAKDQVTPHLSRCVGHLHLLPHEDFNIIKVHVTDDTRILLPAGVLSLNSPSARRTELFNLFLNQ